MYNAYVAVKTLRILVSNKDSCAPPAGGTGGTSGRQAGRVLDCVENNVFSMNLNPPSGDARLDASGALTTVVS